MSTSQAIRTVGAVPARGGGVRGWQSWAPYAAVAWSLVYAALGVYWVVSGSGFPYTPETMSDGLGPLLGRFGPGAAWIVVTMAGIPAAALGVAMLRGVRGNALRPLLLTAGTLLAGVLLLLMTGLNLLVKVGYIPAALVGAVPAEFIHAASWQSLVELLAGAVIFLAAATAVFRLGLKRYESGSAIQVEV